MEKIDNRLSEEFRAYVRLLKDARVHSTHLTRLEGVLVPYHYGMWLMDMGEGKVLLSITEWGGPCWNELLHSKINTEANRCIPCPFACRP